MKTLLAEHGYHPKRESATASAYISMLPGRHENHPSFMVFKKDNIWRDYGYDGGRAHDTITFIMLYHNLSYGKAVDYLVGSERDIRTFVEPPKQTEPSVRVERVEDLRTIEAYNYLRKRNISPHRARLYLKEVTVSFPYGKNPNRKYLLLAHKTDPGGWEGRNAFFKTISVSPKGITTIKGSGETYSIFEGVFDYLSLLEEFKLDRMRNTVIILNSCSFAGGIAPFMEGKKLYCYVDNDKAGDGVINVFREAGAIVYDERHHYPGYNDWNDKINHKKIEND